MDIAKLFRACRVGNIDVVRDLINSKDLDINIKDKWDSSPLYYACLCGHTELVRFLLANGARLEANTFDGERCVHGALTIEIKNILVREYQVISRKVRQRQDYDEFLRRAFENGEYHDVIFNVRKVCFKVHRCVLAARSQYFRQMFQGKWHDRKVITINHEEVNPNAFKVMLHYLYTGILEFHIYLKDDLVKLLRQCKLFTVLNTVEEHCGRITGKTAKAKSKITILLEFPVKTDFYRLYLNSIPNGFCPQSIPEENQENLVPTGSYDDDDDDLSCEQSKPSPSLFSDVIFKVKNLYFHCHKLFFCGQSDFFRALLQDHFYESRETIDRVPVYELSDISVEAFDALTCFIYANYTSLSVEGAFELIMQSDIYLLNSLKKFCANIIGNHVAQLNVIDLIKMARMLSLPKLETTSIEYIANNLEQFLGNTQFHELVMSDAQEVKERHETDTIDIIDDIRYYLNNSSRKDIDAKLEAIDALLDSLGLEA